MLPLTISLTVRNAGGCWCDDDTQRADDRWWRAVGHQPMIAWFAVTAVAAVWFVFRDPRFDYRLLVVGAVVPSCTMIVGGWLLVVNSVVAAMAVLVVVMVVTTGRRPIRRTLLGAPIGMLLHVVFRGVWSSTEVFWWPFTGGDLTTADAVITGGGIAGAIIAEVLGCVAAVVLWRRAGLDDPARRSAFIVNGHLVLS